MTETQITDPRLATIDHAIFVERSTNPDCPVVGLIDEAMRMGDVDLAYEIACDSLKPRRSIKQIILGLIHGKRP